MFDAQTQHAGSSVGTKFYRRALGEATS